MIELIALWAGSYHLDTVPHNPPCAIYDTCKYLPDYNGPLLDTWNLPGYYGGWNSGQPVLCSPFTTKCEGIAVGQS